MGARTWWGRGRGGGEGPGAEGLGVDDSACLVRTTVLFSGTTAVVVVAAVVVISKIIRACGFGNERVERKRASLSAQRCPWIEMNVYIFIGVFWKSSCFCPFSACVL